jgi:hydrogenase-4 component B
MHATEPVLSWIAVATILWIFAALFALIGLGGRAGRWTLAAGGVACMIGAATGLVQGGSAVVPLATLGGFHVHFSLDEAALWLILWAALPASCAAALGGSGRGGSGRWTFGAALGLLGALGVFGLRDGIALLIAWEAMSLGGALMLLADGDDAEGGIAGLFMLALLEVGAVALLLALSALGTGGPGFAAVAERFQNIGFWPAVLLGLLFVVGTGAKLGLLPFYEWFPNVYGRASGSSGALLSGLFLNAAWFVLARALLDWAPGGAVAMTLGIVLLALGAVSAILAILFALQESDWRRLLGYSTAENAGLAVVALGAALVFRAQAQAQLAALAFLVGLIHLGGHALAKGTLLFTADGVRSAAGSYAIEPSGLLRRAPLTLGLGAVFAGMSLAAMPPTIGFVSEWYLFQTIFHDFALHGQGPRIALALAGAGVALTAALALATFVKLLGVGLLGRGEGAAPAARYRLAVLINGLSVPGLAVVLVWLLPLLAANSWPEGIVHAAPAMVHGALLVPLSAGFAFISPAMLMLVGPLLSLPALFAVWLAVGRRGLRRAPLWSGGLPVAPRTATTSLAFSNAMRVFYGFVYRPTNDTRRDYASQRYFVRALRFGYTQSSIFTPLLFKPAVSLVERAAHAFRRLQSGFLNDYIAIVGLLLLAVFAAVFFY